MWNWTERGYITSSAILKPVGLRISDIQSSEYDYRSESPSIKTCTLPNSFFLANHNHLKISAFNHKYICCLYDFSSCCNTS